MNREAIVVARLAEALDCTPAQVAEVFTIEEFHMITATDPARIKEYRKAAERHAELSKVIAKVAGLLAAEDAEFQDWLSLDCGFSSAADLREMARLVASRSAKPKDSRDLVGHLSLPAEDVAAKIASTYPLRGGRENGTKWPARLIAVLVARVFDNLGRAVTFGNKGDESGRPSTDFGRAVQAALTAFDMPAEKEWRGAAEWAFNSGRDHPGRVARGPRRN